ncbi:MAG: glycosyltransferase family 2 protein [Promethearchaeota archaeon]
MIDLLSIIIVIFNDIEIFDCLISLNAQTIKKFEIIIVDNNSKPSYSKKVKKFIERDDSISEISEKIMYVHLDQNLGYVGGNNAGMKLSKGDLILLLNPDTTHDPDFIEKMIDLFNKYPGIHIAQPLINSYPEKSIIWSAGGRVLPLHFSETTHLYGRKSINDVDLDPIYRIDYAIGCAIFIRRNILKKIGLLDPIFFIYNEETDLCMRAFRAGFKNIICYTGTKIYHNCPFELSSLNKKLKYRNRIMFFLKNFSIPVIILQSMMQFISMLIFVADFKKMRLDLEFLKHAISGTLQGYKTGLRRRYLQPRFPFLKFNWHIST